MSWYLTQGQFPGIGPIVLGLVTEGRGLEYAQLAKHSPFIPKRATVSSLSPWVGVGTSPQTGLPNHMNFTVN